MLFPTSHPAAEYTTRQRAREAAVATLEAQHRRLGLLRLLFALAILVAGFLVRTHTVAAYATALLPPLALFLGAVFWQTRVERRRTLAERAVAFYRHGLARIEDRWPGLKPRDHRIAPPHHLYASDLDLFGHGSVFELLCGARTRMGEETLAAWLLAPASLPEIHERHAALVELRERLDLQESMATLGPAYLKAEALAVQPESLLAWAESPDALGGSALRWISALLSMCSLAAILYWAKTEVLFPFMAVCLVGYGLLFYVQPRLRKTMDGTDRALQNLQLLAALLARIEAEPLQSARLVRLQAVLRQSAVCSSQAIAALARLVPYVDALGNPFVRLFLEIPFGYSIQVAYAVQAWRRQHGTAVRGWLAAMGEIEALLSLAAYSYEHPADPLPEFHADGAAFFEAEALGHPLISAEKCVRNDVQFGEEARALIVSGSNMSGKSTLMRSVGISAVMAMAGAPVRAARLRLTPVALGASILINDSLEEGSSRFYAEITRIQQICALAKARGETHIPVLFLLDELLQGTNSSDRLVGATGIVRALLEAGAVGILSTHDLALTALADVDARLRNMHLQDAIAHGRMVFDHTLREGVVTKSNGVELMRLVGLDV